MYRMNGRFVGKDLEDSPCFGKQSTETQRKANRQKNDLHLQHIVHASLSAAKLMVPKSVIFI
jgi:hypothetical protein